MKFIYLTSQKGRKMTKEQKRKLWELDIMVDNILTKPDDKTNFSKDLQDFANTRIAVHIENESDYADFRTALHKNGYEISNAMDYMEGYDPKYPYFYIVAFPPQHMKRVASFENIFRYGEMLPTDLYNANVTLKEFSELDFCQTKEEEMTIDYGS